MLKLKKITLNMELSNKKNRPNGFTIIESLVGVAIFMILVGAVYATIMVIMKQARINLENTTLSYLASQNLEITRNLPYSKIGTSAGNPNGDLPDLTTPKDITTDTGTYQLYYEVTYVDDTADGTILLGTDPAPNDYKQVKLYIKNTVTNKITSFVTNIVPLGLENMADGGALFLSIIDAVGQPVPNATVNIINTTEGINLTRTSDANGKWIEVGLPSGYSNYHIVATKTGYSSDQTYPSSVGNPNPVKPDATIINGQVTAVSFDIDRLSSITYNTLNRTCQVLPNIGIGVRGAKKIGSVPDILKFDNTYTSDSNGAIEINDIEWDNYTPGIVGNTYMIYGSSPIQEINLMPNTNQVFNFILGPKTTNNLLVIVKDGLTGNPIEDATVTLTNPNTTPETNESGITGGSLWSQQYWDGGPGQTDFVDNTSYFEDDGNIDINDIPLAIRLINDGVNTLANYGTLTSSTFDTGSVSTKYTTMNWQPTSQDPETSVKFQIAVNNDNTTWNFVGPDNTNATFYDTPNSTINSSTSGRYIRYKVFLETTNTVKNPTITSVNINYVAGCFTPGQVMFPGLEASNDYELVISKSGYVTQTLYPNISGSAIQQVILNAN